MSEAMTPAPPRSPLKAIVAAFAVASALLLAWMPYRMPAPLDLTAPDDVFSAARASRHLESIAREPHPTGSDAHRDVQRYLIAQIESLGLRPQVQNATQVSPRVSWMNVAARISNIATRIEGTSAQDGAVLLMAHYDSVSTGPGANDNGVAVASLLEIARAFRARGAPRNDVILLFTDAEEDGLLGAEAFVSANPWAKDVRLVINLEARGTNGPSMLFETGAGNAALVGGLRTSAPDAIGSSLFYEVYKHLPNDTDYSVFRQKGVAGLNFAYFGGVTAYHSHIDDLASVDSSVVQQHGGNAFAVARHFADADLNALRPREDAIFFNLPLVGMVVHDMAFAIPFAVGAALLLAIAVFAGVRRGWIRPRRVALAFVLQPLCIAIVTGLVSLLWYGFAMLWPAQDWMPLGEPYAGALLFVALLVLAIALMLATLGRLRRNFEVEELWVAGLAFWALLAIALAMIWPGASYLAIWPIAAGAFALLIALLRRASTPASGLVAILFSAVIPVVFIAPMVCVLYLGLTLNAVMVPLALALSGMLAMLPAFEAIRAAAPRVSVRAAALLALLVIAIVPFLQRFDTEQPRPESLSFAADTVKGSAAWISSDEHPGPWTRHYFGDAHARSPLKLFGAMDYPFMVAKSTPPAGLLPPSIEVISDAVVKGKRRVQVRIASRRGGEQLWINLPPAPRVLSASVDGMRLSAAPQGSDGPWSLRYIAPAPEGIALAIEVEAGKGLEIQAVDRTRGLPDVPLVRKHPRSDDSMSPLDFEEFQDSTFIATSIRLPAS